METLQFTTVIETGMSSINPEQALYFIGTNLFNLFSKYIGEGPDR